MSAATSAFIPSAYQQAIFDWIKNGSGSLMVGATAGSGKTSTAVYAGIHCIQSRSVLYVAFNKPIVATLEEKLQGTGAVVKTTYGIGMGCVIKKLGSVKVDDRKYSSICRDYLKGRANAWLADGVKLGKESEEAAQLGKLVDMVRLTLTDPTNLTAISAMAVSYDILDTPAHLLQSIAPVITAGEAAAKYGKVIDFVDMVYLPYLWRLQPRQYEWVVCDEVQDLSAAQRWLVAQSLSPKGGRFIGIGDRSQAIYAFAGADQNSFDTTKALFSAAELPLSICYRCDADIVAAAQGVLDRTGAVIEARPGAPKGKVWSTEEEKLPALVQEGDTVLCRLTAPLISWCIRLIQLRMPARVLGRDIGRDLVSLLGQIAKLDGYSYEHTGTFLLAYQDMMQRKWGTYDMTSGVGLWIISEENQIRWEMLQDKIMAIRTCWESFSECKDVAALSSEIAALFSDDRAGVTLATVHKAKGKEYPRVFIIKSEKLPLKWKGQSKAAENQEHNLKFVAFTRAQHELCIMTTPKQK